MKKIGVRKIYFWGSNGFFERLVWKDEKTNKYYVRWYHQTVEVMQTDGFETTSNGWKTVEAY